MPSHHPTHDLSLAANEDLSNPVELRPGEFKNIGERDYWGDANGATVSMRSISSMSHEELQNLVTQITGALFFTAAEVDGKPVIAPMINDVATGGAMAVDQILQVLDSYGMCPVDARSVPDLLKKDASVDIQQGEFPKAIGQMASLMQGEDVPSIRSHLEEYRPITAGLLMEDFLSYVRGGDMPGFEYDKCYYAFRDADPCDVSYEEEQEDVNRLVTLIKSEGPAVGIADHLGSMNPVTAGIRIIDLLSHAQGGDLEELDYDKCFRALQAAEEEEERRSNIIGAQAQPEVKSLEFTSDSIKSLKSAHDAFLPNYIDPTEYDKADLEGRRMWFGLEQLQTAMTDKGKVWFDTRTDVMPSVREGLLPHSRRLWYDGDSEMRLLHHTDEYVAVGLSDDGHLLEIWASPRTDAFAASRGLSMEAAEQILSDAWEHIFDRAQANTGCTMVEGFDLDGKRDPDLSMG